MTLTVCLNTGFDSGLPFKGTIDDRTLVNTPPAIFSTKRRMHHQVEGPKALP